MKKISIVITLFFVTFFSVAQKIDLSNMKALRLRNIGPGGMSGRVTSIDVNLKTDAIFIGTASGGVWRSTSGGTDWEPIFDKESTQSVGSVAINQKNPSEIWVGTGEGNPRNSHNSGAGIFKSIDGGKTWKNMGLTETKTIHRIIIHRDNPDIVYVAALGSAWGANEERGVFRTTDGGKTWKKILYANDRTGCADLVADPSNPNKIIAAMWEYGRKPWAFNSGGKGSGLFVTFDGGDSWEQRTEKDGLPKGELGRIGIAIARSNPEVVYAIVEAKENALFRSDDGGFKWKKIAEKGIGDRPFYYSEIYADPKNENRLYTLFSVVNKSEDGGKTFETLLPYYGVHPDHHAFWIHPDRPDYLIEGNDGGLNITHDRGKNWQFVEKIPVGQFYHVSVDNDIPFNVYGGLQDNGSWAGPSSVWRYGGIRNSDWQEVMFGDGFDVLPRRDNNRYGFAMSQGGELNMYDRKTGENTYIKPIHADEKIPLRFNWNAALAQDPFRDLGLYFGSQFVHKTKDAGRSWQIISPDLTTNDTTKIRESKETGGLTPDITSAENHCTILCIAPSPEDENVVWVGTDDGNLQLTQDGGKTWQNLTKNLPNCPASAWIPQIEVSQKNAAEAFVVVNNYRRNDWQPYLYHTKDFGKTWKRLADGKKVGGFCLSVVQDLEEPNLIFLGTDVGLYVTFDGGENWNKYTAGDFPSVPVTDMKIHPRDGDLVLATFGRAIWVLDDIRPLREIARSGGKTMSQDFKLFTAPDAYLANYRSFDGIRFPADGYFQGENKATAARMTVWLNPKANFSKKKDEKTMEKNGEKKDEKGSKKFPTSDEKKKVKIQIFAPNGDTLRTFSTEIDTGINRINWNLERKGVRYPSAYEPPKEDEEPRGRSVFPGIYKVVVTLDSLRKDSTTVKVNADPRSATAIADLEAQEKAMLDYEKIIGKATEAAKRLREVEKIIKIADDQLNNAPDSVKQDISKSGKILKDSIAEIRKIYFGPSEQKGINHSSSTLDGTVWRAISYLDASNGRPTPTAEIAVAQAQKALCNWIESINKFFEKDWASYQKKVEKAQFSLFKKYELIKTE